MGEIENAAPAPKRRIGRPRKSSGGNLETILHIALELFSAQNYSTVTIKDIARAAGVNASLVHYYFDCKEELFLKVVEDAANKAFDTFEAIRHDTVEPRDVLSLWIENHILQFELMRKLIQISLDYATTHSRSPRIDAAIHKFYRMEEEVLGSALERGMVEGVFRRRNVEETITFISTFLDGSLIRAVLFPHEFDQPAAVQHMRHVVLDYLKPE
ncbi:TetR/AcrR family transcriptional regulator [Xanthobacter wiegelii]|uniref:TetR/AcrR family transcriptional regulator n=1 Tax=Xanthobacter wiegelii TaxID=3119913 RepID=UPI00372831A4